MISFWDYFGFRAMWSPYMIIILLGIATLYFLIIGPWRKFIPGSKPVGIGKKILFLSGLLVYYIAQGSPLDLLSHLIFSAHMFSMAISYMLAPPLLLLGIPVWLYQALGRIPYLAKLGVLFKPIVSILVFNGLFSIYHLPVVHDFIKIHYAAHTLFYLVLLFAAFMMWWPIVDPLPDKQKLTDLRKIAYIFANGILLTPSCVLIIFSSNALYATYTDPEMWAIALGYCVPGGNAQLLIDQFTGPEFFRVLSEQDDQQLGGIFMKLTQEVIYGIFLLYTFHNWYLKEYKDDPELIEEQKRAQALQEAQLGRV